MPKSVAGFDPVGLESYIDGERAFDAETIREIEMAIGGLPEGNVKSSRPGPNMDEVVETTMPVRDALVERLEVAAAWYRIEKSFGGRPTHAMLAREFGKIEQAAQRLLEALGAGSPPDTENMPHALKHGGFLAAANLEIKARGLEFTPPAGLLRERLEAIEGVRAWAERLHARYGAKPSTARGKRNSGNVPLDNLLKELAGIWAETLGRQIGLSRDQETQKPAGPFFRFLKLSLPPIVGAENMPGDEAVYTRTRRALRMRP